MFQRRYLIAVAAAFAFSGFAAADDAKKPVKPEGDKPGVKKPEGDKPGAKPAGARSFGRLGKVNAAAKSFILIRKGEGGLREDEFKLADDATVTIDGKPAKLDALKADMNVEVISLGEGKPVTALRATGQKIAGEVKAVTADTITLGGKQERTVNLAREARVMLHGKEAKLTDVKIGDKVFIQMAADDTGALLVTDGGAAGDKPKPGAKPEKPGVKPEKPPVEK